MKKQYFLKAIVLLLAAFIASGIVTIIWSHCMWKGYYEHAIEIPADRLLDHISDMLVCEGGKDAVSQIFPDGQEECLILESLSEENLTEAQLQELIETGSVTIFERAPGMALTVTQYRRVDTDGYIRLRIHSPELERGFMKSVLTLFTICLLIGITAILLVIRHILLPAARLSRAAHKVAEGDFSVRVPELPGNGGMSLFVRDFNLMVGKIENTTILHKNFMSVFSHEFKAPLAAISGYAKLLEKHIHTEQEPLYIQAINMELQQVTETVDNILLVCSLDRKPSPEMLEEVDISEQIRRVFVSMEPRWTEKELSLDLNLEKVPVTGHRWMLEHVWSNLIDNAIKFSLQGGRIEVRVFQANGHSVVTIRNGGDPIPPQQLERIFERFFRAGNGREVRGHGLGMSIVQQIVQLHDGNVTVESSTDTGTVFTVTL